MKKELLVSLIAFSILGCINIVAETLPIYKNPNATIEDRVSDLISRMTIEEKAGQLLCPMGWEMYIKNSDGSIAISDKFRNQNSGNMPVGAYWATLRADPWTQKTLETGLSPKESAETLNMLQKFAVDSTRLGIPFLFAEELPHGHMAIGTTVFPTGLGMASTWNPALIYAAGEAVGSEAASMGVSIGYGPVLDIARDPRWSRMEETLGEDPYLAGEIGSAYMAGMQCPDNKSGRQLFSTLKHFAAYGIPDGGHNGAEASVGPIRLMSELLVPFKKAIENGAGSVMTSYNTIDGIPCTGNRFLLTDILRERWGFKGIVFSDLFSIDGMAGLVAPDRSGAGAIALKAGVDIDLGGSAFGEKTIQALENGLVTEDEIDLAVSRILRIKFLAGLFENPYVNPDEAEGAARNRAHRELSREVARQSITLLKNDGTLPFNRNNISKIAVIGPNADTDYNQLGDYTAPQDPEYVITVLEGIKASAEKNTKINYVKGCAIRDTTMSDIPAAVKAAKEADVAVIVVGGSSARDFKTKYLETGAAENHDNGKEIQLDMDCGEGFDRATLELLGDQDNLLKEVIATGTPTVVIYIQGRPLDMTIAAEKASALLTAWYPGGEGGTAIADVLFGDYNPSGKLPVTIPKSVGQLPLYYYQSIHRDYMDIDGSPLYAFGHGLSYTTFEYSDLEISETDNGCDTICTIKCRVTNTGKYSGEEVIQLYIRDVIASIAQPPMLLKGFNKVKLNPGESKTIIFPLTFKELSIYDSQLREIVEPGEFIVMIGSASDDIRLKGKFDITKSALENWNKSLSE